MTRDWLSEQSSRLLLIMGVSGSGKSTLAANISEQLGWQFVDADDFHSQHNRDKMSRGEPLDDDDRADWMNAIVAHLTEQLAIGQHCVLAYSGLRLVHRRQLYPLMAKVAGIWLYASRNELSRRMQQRTGHFMPASLLTSQFKQWQPFEVDEPVYPLNAMLPPLQQVTVLLSLLDKLDFLPGSPSRAL